MFPRRNDQDKNHANIGMYACMVDYIRTRLFNSNKKVISLDEVASAQIKRLEYELNKFGVNYNQIAKLINTHDVYQFTSGGAEQFLRRFFKSSRTVFCFAKVC